MSESVQSVVAGIDASNAAVAVAAVAADWAIALSVPLALVTVHGTVDAASRAAGHLAGDAKQEEAAVLDHLARLAASLRQDHPELDVTWQAVEATVARGLAASAGTRALLVVGDRGWSALSALLAQPVTDAVVREARGPVLVVPRGDRSATAGPVVLAHDPADPDPTAVELAALASRALGAPLHVVSAVADQEDESAWREVVTRQIGFVLGGDHDPGSSVRIEATRKAQDAVLDAGRGAAVLVLGGRWSRAGSTRGTLGRSVLRRSTAPVLVAPPTSGTESPQ